MIKKGKSKQQAMFIMKLIQDLRFFIRAVIESHRKIFHPLALMRLCESSVRTPNLYRYQK